jgi:hypothetical protein
MQARGEKEGFRRYSAFLPFWAELMLKFKRIRLNAAALKLAIWAVDWLWWQDKDIPRITRSICRLRPVPAQESIRASIAVREFQSPGHLRQGGCVAKSVEAKVLLANH